MTDLVDTHEDFGREQRFTASSDRGFGIVFAAFFTLFALSPLVHREQVRWWALVLAAVILAISLVRPRLLAVPNRAWILLGSMLGKVVSPMALGILYYGAVVPTSWLMRLVGKDVLHLRIDRAAPTYWIKRDPAGPDPKTFSDQF